MMANVVKLYNAAKKMSAYAMRRKRLLIMLTGARKRSNGWLKTQRLKGDKKKVQDLMHSTNCVGGYAENSLQAPMLQSLNQKQSLLSWTSESQTSCNTQLKAGLLSHGSKSLTCLSNYLLFGKGSFISSTMALNQLRWIFFGISSAFVRTKNYIKGSFLWAEKEFVLAYSNHQKWIKHK